MLSLAPIAQKKIFPLRGFSRGCGAQKKGRIGASTTGVRIMRREQFNGRRFLVQILLSINVVIWGAWIARADGPGCRQSGGLSGQTRRSLGASSTAQKPQSAESKSAEYVSDTFKFGCKGIRLWRFDSKSAGKQPAVLFLHGADGGVSAEAMYCRAANRLAEKGLVVCIVHYLDAT